MITVIITTFHYQHSKIFCFQLIFLFSCLSQIQLKFMFLKLLIILILNYYNLFYLNYKKYSESFQIYQNFVNVDDTL